MPRASDPGAAAPPVIVLVRPQLGENIGKAARAMLNFGLTEMRLVCPRDGWPNPAAGPAASGADSVLAERTVFDTVAEAVADCAHVYATTVRKRGITKPVRDARAGRRAPSTPRPGVSAILFGPERSGLDTDDVALARAILTVPINPEFGSLNLAQAVILVAYEWSKGAGAGLAAQRHARSARAAGGAGGDDRPARGHAGAQRLLFPARSRADLKANAAHAADQAGLVEPGNPHRPRRAVGAGGEEGAAGLAQQRRSVAD